MRGESIVLRLYLCRLYTTFEELSDIMVVKMVPIDKSPFKDVVIFNFFIFAATILHGAQNYHHLVWTTKCGVANHR